MNRSFYEYFLSRIEQDGILLESFCDLIVESMHNADRERRNRFGKANEDFVANQLESILNVVVTKATPHEDTREGIDAWMEDDQAGTRTPIQIKSKSDEKDTLIVEVMVNFNPRDRFTKPFVALKRNPETHNGQMLISRAEKIFLLPTDKSKIYEIDPNIVKSIINDTVKDLNSANNGFMPRRGFFLADNGAELQTKPFTDRNRVKLADSAFHYRILIEIPLSIISGIKELELDPTVRWKPYSPPLPRRGERRMVAVAVPRGVEPAQPVVAEIPDDFRAEFETKTNRSYQSTFGPYDSDIADKNKKWLKKLAKEFKYSYMPQPDGSVIIQK